MQNVCGGAARISCSPSCAACAGAATRCTSSATPARFWKSAPGRWGCMCVRSRCAAAPGRSTSSGSWACFCAPALSAGIQHPEADPARQLWRSRFSSRVRARIVFRRVNFPLRRNPLTRLKYNWGIDCIVAISESIRSQLQAGGVKPSRIRTVYEGMDVNLYPRCRPPTCAARDSRNRWDGSPPQCGERACVTWWKQLP